MSRVRTGRNELFVSFHYVESTGVFISSWSFLLFNQNIIMKDLLK